MKFRNQTRFAGRTISNVLNKPLMRKKGKQWIVVSLSALMLLGLGGVAATSTHAAAVPNSRAQTMAVKSGMNKALAQSASAPSSASSSKASSASATSVQPSDVEAQAKQMKAGLMKTAMVHQPATAGRMGSTSASAKSGSAKPVSAKSASDNGMQILGLGNGLQQAKRWNFVQNGINHQDFVPTNVSGSNRVNSKASGNQTVSASSANAKSSVASVNNNSVNAPSAKKPFNSAYNSYEAQMSGVDAQVSNANAVNAGSSSNSNDHEALLKDDASQPAQDSDVTDILQYEDTANSANDEVGSGAVQGKPNSAVPSSAINDNLPSGYSLASNENISFGSTDSNVIIPVHAIQQNGTIDLKPNEVTVTGTIQLQFNNKQGNITTVPLQYGFQTSDDNSATSTNSKGNAVNALDHTDFFDNVSDPNGYAKGHDVFRLDNGQPIHASDFSYTGATGENAPYMINVSKQNGEYANGSQHHIFQNITLNFDAKDNPNSDTETINYVDPNGNNVGSRTVQASDGTQLPTDNNSKQGTIGGNVPQGYTINGNNPATVIMHKGGNQIIHVTPTNDTPADITGATQPQPNGKSKIISGNNGQNGQNGKDVDGTTPTQLNKGNVVPKGYHVDPNNPVSPVTDQNGHQENDNNGKPKYTVNVQPNNEHMVVRYYYDNAGKQIFVGDDHFTGAYNTSYTVTDSNDKGLNSGYQLINGNPANTFKFGSDRDDNNIAKVPVTMKMASDTVDVHDANGNPVNKEGQPIINGKAKNGDNTTKTIIIKGQDGHTMTPSDLTKSGQLPKGYHATSSVTPGVKGKNGQNPSVQITPNSEHEFVQYYYTDANGNKVQVGNTIVQGQYGKSDTLNNASAKGLDSGYQLTGKSDSFTFQSDRDDNNIAQVPVKPQAFTNKDTVTFKDINGKTIGQGTVPADSTPSDAGKNIEGKGSNQNDKNQVPNGYHIINSDQTVNPDNGNHTVLVAPNAGTPAVMSYKKPGTNSDVRIVDNNGEPLNGVNGQKVTPSDLDNSGLLPKGYHATNGAVYGNNGKDGNTPQVINIAPDEESEIVRYYYYGKNGQKVFVGDDYFDGQSGTKADVTSHDNAQPDAVKLSDNGLNSGYILNNANNDFTFKANSDASAADTNNENVMMVPVHLANTNTSDTIQYVNVDGNVVNTTSNKSDFVVGKGAPSDVIPDNTIKSELPSDYQVVDPNQVVHFNGAKHTVLVAPVQATKYIAFYPNDNKGNKPMVVPITGNKGSKVNLNKYVPQGYHLETKTQTGQPVNSDITLEPNKVSDATKNASDQFGADANQSADTILYVDNDNDANRGNVVGSYQTGGGNGGTPLAGNDVPTLTKADSHDNVPLGYQVDTTDPTNNTSLTYDGLTHVIYVKGVVPSNAQQNNVTVNIYKKGSNGNSLVKTMTVNEPGIIGSSYTINPTDPDILSNVPTGAAPEASDVPVAGQITTNGLTVKNVNFTYDVPTGASNTIMVYYRTKDGRTLNFGAINDSHKGDTGDVTQKVSVPQGFEVVPNQKQSTKYVVTSEPQYISVLIQGEPAKDIFNSQNSDKTHINVNYIYRNSNGSFTKSYNTKFDYTHANIGDEIFFHPADGLISTGSPEGYTIDPADQQVASTLTTNGASPNRIDFMYDAQNKKANISYSAVNNKGQKVPVPANSYNMSVNTNSDITSQIKVPEGYHIVPNEHVIVPSNSDTTENMTVQLAGNKVVGYAKLNLLYERGNHVSDEVKVLPISGSIGDSPVVINPQDFDKQGYQIASAKNDSWSIPFDIDNVKKTDNGDTFRYTPEQTFVYKATPVTINVGYVDTQTGNSVANPDNGQTVTAYDGDTIDLEDVNASNNTSSTDDNSNKGGNDNTAVISVDGHNYRLNLPEGYHLAHTNNYIKVASNGSYVKKESNGVGGFRMVRMPLMKLTLGIMPHFHKHNTQPAKPASKGSVTPAKPASASSVSPSSASSASVAPASQMSNVTPVSNNTSVAPASSASTAYVPTDNYYINNTSNSSYITNNYNYSNVSASSSVSSATSAESSNAAHEPLQSSSVRANVPRAKNFKAVQNMSVGSTVSYHGMIIKRISQKAQNLFYFYVIKPCYVHSKMSFAKHTFVRYLSVKKGWTLPIQRIFRINGRTRFEVRWGHHLYFVTGDRHFTRNAYYQRRDMRRNGHSFRHIQILRGCCEYRFRHFNYITEVKGLHRSMVLKVRRVVTIAHKHMTRFQLTNGRWVTSNKNFVKLVK